MQEGREGPRRGVTRKQVSVTVPEGCEVDASARGLKESEASTMQGYAWTKNHVTKCDQRFTRSKQCGVSRDSQRPWGKDHWVQQLVKCQAASADSVERGLPERLMLCQEDQRASHTLSH